MVLFSKYVCASNIFRFSLDRNFGFYMFSLLIFNDTGQVGLILAKLVSVYQDRIKFIEHEICLEMVQQFNHNFKLCIKMPWRHVS